MGVADHEGAKISRLAVQTGVFPLYEVENGIKYALNYGSQGIPVSNYITRQKRYRHLSSEQIDEIQQVVNADWENFKVKFNA